MAEVNAAVVTTLVQTNKKKRPYYTETKIPPFSLVPIATALIVFLAQSEFEPTCVIKYPT